MRRWLAAAAVALGALTAPAASVADTLTVTTTADSGSGSLRERVGAANTGDTVFLPASANHYVVNGGKIDIGKQITIAGAGAGKSVVDAEGVNRIFDVVAPSSSTVDFKALKLTGGHHGAGLGGAVVVDGGSIALTDVVVSGNDVTSNNAFPSDGGGGIYNRAGDTTLTRSSVTDNQVTVTTSGYCCHGGGGIYSNSATGKVVLKDHSHVDRNHVTVTGAATDSNTSRFSGGGGIYQDATGDVTITDSTVSGNTVDYSGGSCCHGGGGVYFNPGGNSTLKVTRGAVDGNKVTVDGPVSGNGNAHCCHGGGAIMMNNGFLVLLASALNGNTADITSGDCCQGGGAVSNDAPSSHPTSVTATTIAGNTAKVTGGGCCSGGGAFYLDLGSSSGLTMNGSLLSGNVATFSGGAMLSGGGAMYHDTGSSHGYLNTTISGNSTDAAGPQQGGGGIYLLDALSDPTTLANVTLAGNRAPSGSGGGVFSASSTLRTKNSILAQNSAATGADCAGANVANRGNAVYTSLGYNIDSAPDSCGFTAAGDRAVASASLGLAGLAANGGPTLTRALALGSPALDGANPAGCTDLAGLPLPVDQRGARRPADGNGDLTARCDVGAFEAVTRVPRCTLVPGSSKVALRKKKKKPTLKVTARCDEAVSATLAGKFRIKLKATKHKGKKKHKKAKTVSAAIVTASLKPNLAVVLKVKLPKKAVKALKSHAQESAAFLLTAKNVDGTTTANASIAKLKLQKKKRKKH